MAVRKRVVVSGRVQGVFFRETCRQRAESEGLGGWVANRDSGDVEACFEGAPQAVERMVEWCHTGPEGARVASVAVHEEAPQGATDFTVR